MDFMAIALRTAKQTAFNLIIEGIRATKPAFEFVIVVAAEVVNDHVFNLSCRTGVD